MSVLLARGQLADGSRLFSDATYAQITSIVTPLSVPQMPPELSGLQRNFAGYALGLNVVDYKGRKVFMHTGGLPGYVSKVFWMPSAQLGVTVLTNQESSGAFDSIVYRVADHYLGAPAFDWSAAFSKLQAAQTAAIAAEQQKATGTRAKDSRPSLPLANYAGTYTDSWYGDIAIANENGKLVMRFTKTPGLVGDLEHWQYDTFIVRWRDRELRADAYVSVRAQSRRQHRSGEDARRVLGNRLQLRLSGPAPETSAQIGPIQMFQSRSRVALTTAVCVAACGGDARRSAGQDASARGDADDGRLRLLRRGGQAGAAHRVGRHHRRRYAAHQPPRGAREGGRKPEDIQASLRAIVDGVTDKGPGGHILTGPVFVEGAEPGDALEVKILSIDLADRLRLQRLQRLPARELHAQHAVEDHSARSQDDDGDVCAGHRRAVAPVLRQHGRGAAALGGPHQQQSAVDSRRESRQQGARRRHYAVHPGARGGRAVRGRRRPRRAGRRRSRSDRYRDVAARPPAAHRPQGHDARVAARGNAHRTTSAWARTRI